MSPDDNDFEETEVASVFFDRQGEKYPFELGYVDLCQCEFLECTGEEGEVNGLQILLG